MGSPDDGTEPIDRVAETMRTRPQEFGTAVGVGGLAGAFAAANLDRTRAAIDAVSPATARGALKVLALTVVIIGLALLGNLLLPSVGVLWLLIAAAVVIGLNEQHRRSRPPTE